jgi:V8-like Glu-specific endopeptidase
MTRAARIRAYITLAAAFLACSAAATMGQAVAGTTARPAAAHTRPVSHPAAAHTRPVSHPAAALGHPSGALGQLSGIEGHAAAVSARQQQRVRRYWTAWRMRHARPLRPAGAARPGGKARAARRTWMSAPVTPGRAKPLASSPPAQAASPRGGWLSVPPQAAQRAPLAPALAASTAVARWSGGGAVADTTGKVFFSMGGDDYVCSGSTVASTNSDVVLTAAHCVKNGSGTWAANWTFVPGYSDGDAPYGSYTARQFYVSSAWSAKGDNDYDVAFVTVNQASLSGDAVPVGEEVGGQGIRFGVQPRVTTVFGYPSDPPYTGQQLFYCSGATTPDPYHATSDVGVHCGMTAGSSGGPWLDGFDWATGTGTITSVSSFKYSNNNQILYGPRLGSAAQSLYQAAEHS